MATEVHRTEILELAELERDLQQQYEDLTQAQETFPTLFERATAADEALTTLRAEWEELSPALDNLRERIVEARCGVLDRISVVLNQGA